MACDNSLACIVYGLFSSDDGAIRYIGQTKRSLSKRHAAHIAVSRRGKTHRDYWVRAVLKRGATVESFVLCNDAVWNETEVALIAAYRSLGADLVNATCGGEGVRDPADHVRMRISESRRGSIASDEARRAMSESHKMRGISPEQRERMVAGVRKAYEERGAEIRKKLSLSRTGSVFSSERRANIAKSKIGSKHTDETKLALSKIGAARFADPLERDRISALTKSSMAHQDVRSKMSASAVARWSDPEQKRIISQRLKAMAQSPEARLMAARASAKMNDDQVYEARMLAKLGWRASELCRKYGITDCPMSLLLRGKTFKHVPMPSDADADAFQQAGI